MVSRGFSIPVVEEQKQSEFLIFDNKLFKCENSICNEVIENEFQQVQNDQQPLQSFPEQQSFHQPEEFLVQNPNTNFFNQPENFATICDDQGNCRQELVNSDGNTVSSTTFIETTGGCLPPNCQSESRSGNLVVSVGKDSLNEAKNCEGFPCLEADHLISSASSIIEDQSNSFITSDKQWRGIDLDDLVILGAFSL